MAVFTAFSDESGAQDPLGSFVVGGYVGSIDTWAYFTRAWQERVLNPPPKIPYLHMTEIRRQTFKDRYGLTDLQAEDKVSMAVNVIATTGGLSAVHSEVKRADIERVRTQLAEQRIKAGFSLRDPDYMCFLGYSYNLVNAVRRDYPDAEQIDFVVARKKKISEHLKTFHEDLMAFVAEFSPALASLAGRLVPDDMETSPPLQAADVFCWHAMQFHESGIQNNNLSFLWHGNPSVRPHSWSREDLDRLAKGLIRVAQSRNPESVP